MSGEEKEVADEEGGEGCGARSGFDDGESGCALQALASLRGEYLLAKMRNKGMMLVAVLCFLGSAVRVSRLLKY